jgi:hypothetical protein
MEQPLTLICPTCGGKTRLEQGATRIKCDYCGVEQVLPAQGAAASPWVVEKPPVPLPERIQLEKRGQSITLKWRWFSLKFVFLAIFSLFWMFFLLFFYGMLFSSGAPSFVALFPLIHVAVGVGMGYSALAGFLNTTTVRINVKEFVIEHGPLPWIGGVQLPVTDLAQLYTREKYTRTENSSSFTYELWAELKNQRSKKLLSGLEDPSLVQYLEQQIESFLQIQDRPVAGEYGVGAYTPRKR